MIIINGKKISGNNIVINNGKVIIDGVDQTPEGKEINIVCEQAVNKIEVDYCNTIQAKGNVGSLVTTSGDVEVSGNIEGDVQCTSGDVEAADIHGSVKTVSGDVDAGRIIGSVTTMSGDVKYKNGK